MILTTMHRTLAKASADFGPSLFAGQDFQELIKAAVEQSGAWQKRSCALTAPFVVLFVVAMTFFRPVSQKNILKQLLMWLRSARVPGLSLRAVTPEAVCHARERLGVRPLKALFETQASRIRAVPLFHGLRAWVIDGVHMTLPDTPANVAEYGRPQSGRGEGGFPQMTAVALVEASSRQVRDIEMGPVNLPERPSCLRQLRHLGEHDLLLMDRGFAAAWLFEEILGRKSHFLARIAKSWKPEMLMRLGPGDWLVRIAGEAPRENGKGPVRKVSLTLRMLEYQIGGERSRLVTDLTDPDTYPARDLALFYHRRWEVDICHSRCTSCYDLPSLYSPAA